MTARSCSRRPTLTLAVCLCLLAAGCTTARQRRETIEEIDRTWETHTPDDSLEEMLDNVDALGAKRPSDPQALASVPLLCRQVATSPAAIVRAQALRAGWKLCAELPVEPYREDDLPASEFIERAMAFEELELDPELAEPGELEELATFLGNYRFGADEIRFAIDMADMVVSRALWTEPGPLRERFTELMGGSARHAMTLVTVKAANDTFAFVREEAMRSARFLDSPVALPLIESSLLGEPDSQVVLAALSSFAVLAPDVREDQVEALLSLIDSRQDIVLRQRADAIREARQLRAREVTS